ncbi:MAG: hypothetical protein Kow0089_05330 [Desulfobulbaceae bacterium]
MGDNRKGFGWRTGFALFCLLYTACAVYLGLDNFDKVQGEYSRAAEKLRPDRIEEIARMELAAECRAKLKRSGRIRPVDIAAEAERLCASFPAADLEARRKTVAARLETDRKRFFRKILVFAISFSVFFLAIPLGLLYLLLALLAWIFKDMKFIR